MTDNREPQSPKNIYNIKGGCYCGATSYEINGKPFLSAYCHCTLCQRLSGAPFINTIHVPYGSLKWTHTTITSSPSIQSPSESNPQSQSQLESTSPSLPPPPPSSIPGLQVYSVKDKPWKMRYRCLNCGACVASYHGKNERWSIWGSHLKWNSDGNENGDGDEVVQKEKDFEPRLHIFYGTRMLDINDGLPKWSGYENVSERLG